MNSIFEITIYKCQADGYLPGCGISPIGKAFAENLGQAEDLIQQVVKTDCSNNLIEKIHHIRVKEYEIGSTVFLDETISERIYDENGILLDRTLVSKIPDTNGDFEIFWGRDDRQLRFSPGTIVEVLSNGYIELGVILDYSISKERACELNREGRVTLDYTDDTYMVRKSSDTEMMWHHVDPVLLFNPGFPVPLPIKARLQGYFRNFIIEEYTEKDKKRLYHLTDCEELIGYMWLKPATTGLHLDIFADDGMAYVRDSHIPLIIVRNGYDRTVSDFIPISIEKKPKLLDRFILNVAPEDLLAVFRFIAQNKQLLLSFADKEITHEQFVENLQQHGEGI